MEEVEYLLGGVGHLRGQRQSRVIVEFEQLCGIVAKPEYVLDQRVVVPAPCIGTLIGSTRDPGLVEALAQRLGFSVRYDGDVSRWVQR